MCISSETITMVCFNKQRGALGNNLIGIINSPIKWRDTRVKVDKILFIFSYSVLQISAHGVG